MRDMNGKTLATGDTVMMVGTRVRAEYQGHVGEITGDAPDVYQRLMQLDGFDPAGCFTIDHDTLAHCTQVVRLDEPGVANWDHVAAATGWRPGWGSTPDRDWRQHINCRCKIVRINPSK